MVNFHNETENLPGPKETKVAANWLTDIAKDHKKEVVNLSYVFCTDDYLLSLNQKHLNHDTYTDIITFNNADNEHQIEADIFISLERVKENASTFNTTYQNELHRVLVHGLLHLLGNNDKTPGEKKKMTELENNALSNLKRFT